ncbi:MAG: hypothetical protein ACXWCY_16575 [Burkholderiales bacterium]
MARWQLRITTSLVHDRALAHGTGALGRQVVFQSFTQAACVANRANYRRIVRVFWYRDTSSLHDALQHRAPNLRAAALNRAVDLLIVNASGRRI